MLTEWSLKVGRYATELILKGHWVLREMSLGVYEKLKCHRM